MSVRQCLSTSMRQRGPECLPGPGPSHLGRERSEPTSDSRELYSATFATGSGPNRLRAHQLTVVAHHRPVTEHVKPSGHLSSPAFRCFLSNRRWELTAPSSLTLPKMMNPRGGAPEGASVCQEPTARIRQFLAPNGQPLPAQATSRQRPPAFAD